MRSLFIRRHISSFVLIQISLKISFLYTYLPEVLSFAAYIDKKQPTSMSFNPTEQNEYLGILATE